MFPIRPSIFLILSATIVVASGACPYQLCTCSRSSIYCVGSGYTFLPIINDTGTDFQQMTIEMFSLKEIPDNSLPSNLKTLKIYATPLFTVGSHAFDRIGKTLNHLEMSEMRFTRIPDAFSALQNLTYFQFQYSNITDWNEDALKHIGPTVQTLNLVKVDSLTTWPEWMKYFTALQTLQLSGDPVTSIPDDAFDGFKDTITYISVNADKVTEISTAFTTLGKLKTLYIMNNNFTQMKNLPNSTVLNALGLYNNGLANSTSVYLSLLPFANTLTFLDLSQNKLTVFPDFSVLSVLSDLNLDQNQLTDPKTSSLPASLTSLSMRNNNLTKVPLSGKPFANLTQVVLQSNKISELNAEDIPAAIPRLDVRYNQITSLQQSSFPENSSLMYMDLSGNLLLNISATAFKNVGGLENLRMMETNMTRLPMALSYLTKLKMLSLADNRNLQCTCDEAGLLTWYKSLPNLSLNGNCGNMSIPNFFEKVAPNCSTLF